MKNFILKLSANLITQFVLYFLINGFFIFKYTTRYNINPYLAMAFYIVFVWLYIFLFTKKTIHWSEKVHKIIYISSLLITAVFIYIVLSLINPYTIRVDRWSALTFFWDSIFSGIYPYGVHTHIGETNFASPFPFWHLINLPFYLMKDVGFGLIFFLLLTAYGIYKYFNSYKKALYFLFLLLLSPAYWWEILVRSDGLNNTILVLLFIMWYEKSRKDINANFILTAFICGLFAGTRFSALIPLAIFFFRSYLTLSIKRKIAFPILVLLIVTVIFLPFIFWDTDNWVFFSRNPFMSQTNNGNLYTMLIMMGVGILMALSWTNIKQYFAITSLMIFIFMLTMQLVRMLHYPGSTFFGDAIVDISYFTLALPYSISFLTTSKFNINN